MKRISIVLLGLLISLFFACQNNSKPNMSELAKMEGAQKPKDGIFIHICSGYNNPEKVLTALNLALGLSEINNVELFFDLDAVELLKKTSENIELQNFLSLHESLDSIIKNNIPIIVNTRSIKYSGIEQDQLIEGVTMIDDKKILFSFTKGRIISLNY